MRLPLAIATLLLATSTALPAFASAPNGHYFYSHGNNGYNAYASAPRNARAAAPRARRQIPAGWGHCVSGLEQGGRSAYPSWDVC